MIPKEALCALLALVAVSVIYGVAFGRMVNSWKKDWEEHKNEGVEHENGWEEDISC